MGTTVEESLGDLLFGRTRQAVLGLLFTRPDESFHVRQVVRLTGAALGATQRELARLAAAGLLRREQRGRQVFFSVNRESPVHEEMRGLVLKTAGLADILRQALLPLRPRLQAAFIFGSFAQATHHRDSDVDLLAVGELSFTELARAIAPAQQHLGREVNPTLYRKDELARKLAEGHHFLSQVMAGPRIHLVGDEHELRRMAAVGVDSPARGHRQRNRGSAERHRSRHQGLGRRAD